MVLTRADYLFIHNYIRSLLNNMLIPILMVRTGFEPASYSYIYIYIYISIILYNLYITLIIIIIIPNLFSLNEPNEFHMEIIGYIISVFHIHTIILYIFYFFYK